MATTYEHLKVEKLRPHPLNQQVFGDLSSEQDDIEFIQSIRERGVIEPLVVTGNHMMISGHRRKQGAIRAGLTEVPCLVRRDLADEHAVNMAWFDANRTREKTTEQKARWFSQREAFLAKEAKRRQSGAGGASPSGASSKSASPPTGGKRSGESARIAAKEVGMGHNTAKAAVEVVKVIDEATANGDTATAAHLRDTLNNKSVTKAKVEADKVKPPAKKRTGKKRTKKPDSPLKPIKKASGDLSRALAKAAKSHGEGPHYKAIFAALTSINEAVEKWEAAL